MFSQVFYLIRAKADGQYLMARPLQTEEREGRSTTEQTYLILFKEHFDALTYLNTHGADLVDQFAVESMPGGQLGSVIKRWGFTGIGLVEDPLLPQIEFLQYKTNPEV